MTTALYKHKVTVVSVILTVYCFSYFFPCQRWLAVDEDDGQIARELVPVDETLRQKLAGKDTTAIRDEIALETKGRVLIAV